MSNRLPIVEPACLCAMRANKTCVSRDGQYLFPELATAASRRTLHFADLNTAGEDGGAGLHGEALFATGHDQSVEAAVSPSSAVSSANSLNTAERTRLAFSAASVRSGLGEFSGINSRDHQVASDFTDTSRKTWLRQVDENTGWQNAFRRNSIDTLTDSPDIHNFFSGLADDSGVPDILTDNTVGIR